MNSEKIRKMIGQMVVVGFRGTEVTPDHEIVRDLVNLNIGGIVLFNNDVALKSNKRNITDKGQVRKLIQYLQRLTNNSLLVSLDQEGGNVARLGTSNGYEKSKTAEELGNLDDLEVTRSTSKLIASQVAECGFNLNFAPVVDLNINKDNPVIGRLGRSISADPLKVVRHAKVFIEEHSKQNVLTCAKHFMGHGSSEKDTHLSMADVTHTYKETESVPYRLLAEKGLLDMVMTAHVYNRNIDEKYPFTLSKHVITHILRNEIEFKGVVISDDMQMKAITDHFSFDEAVLLAVNAGIDIILIPNNINYNPTAHIKTINIIYDNVKSGRIPYQRIEESFNRVAQLKKKIGLEINA